MKSRVEYSGKHQNTEWTEFEPECLNEMKQTELKKTSGLVGEQVRDHVGSEQRKMSGSQDMIWISSRDSTVHPPPPNSANSFAVRRMCTTTAKLPGTASPYSLNGSRTLKKNRLSPGGEGPSLTAMLLGTHALSPTFSFKKVVVAEK